MPIPNEDQLKSMYDRINEHPASESDSDWILGIEEMNALKNKEAEERIADAIERIFGVR